MDGGRSGHSGGVDILLAATAGGPDGLASARGPARAAPCHGTGQALIAHPAGGTLEVAAVYEEHFDFVWRSVRRLGVAERALDDAVQEVFIVVHRRLADFEGRSSLKSWLFAIARRVAKDHRRRASRKDRTEALPEVLADPHARSPLEGAERAQAVRLLYEILDSLDDDKREVFILAELEQMTVPEIAAAISVNLNTVYSRLRAARQAFEKALARQQAQQRRGQ